MTAEGTGVFWAMCWAMAQAKLKKVPYTIWSDSLTSVGRAKGQNFWIKNGEVGKSLRSLAYIFEEECMGRFSHIKGHSGHPWNEGADSLAAAIVGGQIAACPAMPDMKSWLVSQSDQEWSWLRHVRPSLAMAYPSIEGSYLCAAKPVLEMHAESGMRQLAATGLLRTTGPDDTVGNDVRGKRECIVDASQRMHKLATANVLTMNPSRKRLKSKKFKPCSGVGNEECGTCWTVEDDGDAGSVTGRMLTGRPLVLANEFKRAKLGMVGVQEAMTMEGSVLLRDSSYLIMSSGRDPSGSYGNEPWIDLIAE